MDKKPLDFPDAFSRIAKERQKWRRERWNQGTFVAARFPSSGTENDKPYLYMRWLTVGGKERREPWTPNDQDLFSDDWEIFDDFEEDG